MFRISKNLWTRSIVLCFFFVACFHFIRRPNNNSCPSAGKELQRPAKVTTVVDVKMFQNILNCLCTRTFMYSPKLSKGIVGGSYARLNSSCSDEGTYYQSGQNVISMSLWHDPKATPARLKNYQEGIFANLQMIRHHYPGYSLRLYTNISLNYNNESGYCDLLCLNEDLFWCDITNTPSHGDVSLMVSSSWRFLALGDPTVNIFHSRDLDSLISYREAAVERDWLANNDHKAIMLMRDNKEFHRRLPMLGGMWGADNTKLTNLSIGENLRTDIIQLSKFAAYHEYSGDQTILNQVIFYRISRDIVAYDSYHCVYWSNYTEVRAFPSKRSNRWHDFVGNIINFTGCQILKNSWGSASVCPLECRPEYGKDWIYC